MMPRTKAMFLSRVLLVSFGLGFAAGLSSASLSEADPKDEEVLDPSAAEAQAEAAESGLVKMLLELHEAEPEDGVVIYTIARQMLGEGRTDDALAWLRRLESATWDDLLEPTDFAAISKDPSYVEIASRLAARARVVQGAEVAFELDLPDLAPEGTAWDPRRREVLLSSGHKRKVVAVDGRGRTRDLTTEAQDGLLAVLGMEVDHRDRLWVASTAAPFMRGFSPELAGKAAVHAFDLATGQTIGTWPADRQPALLNDLTVATDGTVYVTDSVNGCILALDTDEGSWAPLGVNVDFIGPNGLALSGSEESLFVADFLGLTRIDLSCGAAERLSTPPGVGSLGGIDGLRYYEGSFIAIQNVIGPGRIWRIELDEAEHRLASAELLEAGNPIFQNPTTGAVAGNEFVFLANPRLQPASENGLQPLPKGGRLKLLRLPLANASHPAVSNPEEPGTGPVGDARTADSMAGVLDHDGDKLRQLEAASDAWWTLWLPPETADLDLAAELEGAAAGFGYFGNPLRSIDEIDAWKARMRAWLDTLESLDYHPIGRTFRIIGDTGLEWGHYYERQVKKGGEVRRDHQGRYTLTWVLTPRGWRIASYHRSSMPDDS